MDETATFSEFARIAGFSRSYITQLRKDDRLVLDGAGRRIRVAETLERIRATRDPAKAGVAARHAKERAAKANTSAPASGAGAEPPAGEMPNDRTTSTYQAARAIKERYLAMAAKRDYEISIGKLLEAATVEAEAGNAITTLRARLENLPDVLAPQLAASTDEHAVRAALVEEIEHALQELARQFARLSKQQEVDDA